MAVNDADGCGSLAAVEPSMSDRILWKKIGRGRPRDFMKMEGIAALLLGSIHSHIGMLQ